jgi:hypothetical protein
MKATAVLDLLANGSRAFNCCGLSPVLMLAAETHFPPIGGSGGPFSVPRPSA